MNNVVFVVPEHLETPTGGYAYDRRMIIELQRLGWWVDIVELGAGYPHPSNGLCKASRARLLALPGNCPIVIDGLAYGVLAETAALLCRCRPLIALVHHPLALESGLSPANAEKLRASERSALKSASHVVVTSRTTAELLVHEYDVARGKITIAVPGTDPTPGSAGSQGGMVELLAVGAIVPRKGFDVLIAALAMVADLDWHLTIAGDRSRDYETVTQLDAAVDRLGLGGRVRVLGAVSNERLAELYGRADLFVLASRFEGYGMAFSEATSWGVPVIGTTAGAIAEAVPAGAGVLVPPDDCVALARALRRLIENPHLRRQMATSARIAARSLPTWDSSARLLARAIESTL